MVAFRAAAILACVAAASVADVIVLSPEGVRNLEEIRRLIRPAEPSKDTAGRLILRGRILTELPPSADQPTRYLFAALDERGALVSERGELLPYGWVSILTAEPDTLFDLRRLLSDRHEALGVPLGAPAHLAAVLAAIDEDGALGLRGDGAPAALPAGGKESYLVQFVRSGPLPVEELQRLIREGSVEAPLLQPATNVAWTCRLIDAVAMDRKYGGFEPGFGKAATASLLLLASFGKVAPERVHEGAVERAQRCRLIDQILRGAVGSTLTPPPQVKDLRSREPPSLAVGFAESAAVALELVEAGGTFHVYRPRDSLLLLIGVLVAGTGFREAHASYEPTEPMTRKATEVAVKLLRSWRAGEPEGNAEILRDVHAWLEDRRPAWRRFAREVLVRFGWGPIEEAGPLVKSLLNGAVHPGKDYELKKPEPGASRAEMRDDRIRTLLLLAKSDNQDLADLVRAGLREIRLEAVEMEREGKEHPEHDEFFARWAQLERDEG